MNDGIFNAVKRIKEGSLMNFEYTTEIQTEHKNEFVIILKPECFISSHSAFDVVNSIFNICRDHDIVIHGFNAFNGLYAQRQAYIENEYYMLNRGARYGFDHLPFEYKAEIKRRYEDYIIIGAYGFLEFANNDYTAKSLEEVTETRLSDKIGNGTYVLPLQYKDENYAIINAFHPEQVNHFNNPQHITIALFCSSNTDYSTLASKCIGHYVPERAEQGSIRHYLYRFQEKYGITINNLFNGVHISPSPLEGMFGFYRYSKYFRQDLSRSLLCKNLIDIGLRIDQVYSLLDNPTCLYREKITDIFNLCEAHNAEEIITLIQEIYL